jgi:hypothetical protein
MATFDPNITSSSPSTFVNGTGRPSDWSAGVPAYGVTGFNEGIALNDFKLPDITPLDFTTSVAPALAFNTNGGWSNWVNGDGVVANVSLMDFLTQAKNNINGALSPQLGYPKKTTQSSHITYDPYLGQATFTFKAGDNPGLAAQDIADSYPSVPAIPKTILHRAVMMELDEQSRGKMQNEDDARNIDIGTTLNVNNILVRAALLYETLGFDKAMADLVNPYPGQEPIVKAKKPVKDTNEADKPEDKLKADKPTIPIEPSATTTTKPSTDGNTPVEKPGSKPVIPQETSQKANKQAGLGNTTKALEVLVA